MLDKNYPPPQEEPSAAPPSAAADARDIGNDDPDDTLPNLDEPNLDDTLPLSDDGQPENYEVDPVEDMEKPATNQILLDKYF